MHIAIPHFSPFITYKKPAQDTFSFAFPLTSNGNKEENKHISAKNINNINTGIKG